MSLIPLRTLKHISVQVSPFMKQQRPGGFGKVTASHLGTGLSCRIFLNSSADIKQNRVYWPHIAQALTVAMNLESGTTG